MKVFVDTNVLIDFVCNRTDFYDQAESIFALGLSGKIDICFSDVSVINTLYVGKKYNYTQDELCNQLIDILRYCSISSMNDEVVVESLCSEWKDKEDATQYFSAAVSSADVIITRNPKDFALSSIRVESPSDFLNQMK